MNINPIRSILVHVDATPGCPARLKLARQLAQQHDAALTALYAVTPAYMEVPLDFAGGGEAAVILQGLEDERRATALAMVKHEQTVPGAPVDWAETGDEPMLREFARRALYADLVVAGQREPSQPYNGVPPDFVEITVLSCGRPVLVLPYAGAVPALPGTVLIAWKETPQAARAVSSALPLLRTARHVHVVNWEETSHQRNATASIVTFLRRHGVEAQHHAPGKPPEEIGEAILSMAADVSADLLVMGCYGHSRARELVLGGASRTILRSMTLPVLLSH
nr:universal stress protein [uncultured Caldimonas sp.]